MCIYIYIYIYIFCGEDCIFTADDVVEAMKLLRPKPRCRDSAPCGQYSY